MTGTAQTTVKYNTANINLLNSAEPGSEVLYEPDSTGAACPGTTSSLSRTLFSPPRCFHPCQGVSDVKWRKDVKQKDNRKDKRGIKKEKRSETRRKRREKEE